MRILALALAGAALLVPAAGAAEPAEAASGRAGEPVEPVRVYTNADLEAFGPASPETSAPPGPEEIARRWEFVQSVLDESHARIDADRRHELERQLTEAQSDALDRIDSRPRYGLPFSYYGPPGYHAGYGPRVDRGHPAASRLWERPNAELFRPITPIHARPYASNLFRIEARPPAPPPPAGARPHHRH